MSSSTACCVLFSRIDLKTPDRNVLIAAGKLDRTTSIPLTSSLSQGLPSWFITHWAYRFFAIHIPALDMSSCFISNLCLLTLCIRCAYKSYILLIYVCTSSATGKIAFAIAALSVISIFGKRFSIIGFAEKNTESVSV